MIHKSFVAVCVLGMVSAGCAVAVESSEFGPSDVKPEDGSELASAGLGSTQQPHAEHYTDFTNQWMETNYPMGTDNPNCKDWWVYDRYLANRPARTATRFSTFDTAHNFARGTYVDSMIAMIPSSLGYTDAMKASLVDHNSVVARSNGRCSGRYVFQWDNHTDGGAFEATKYWAGVELPPRFIAQNEAACKSALGPSVPAALIDLYVCEAPPGEYVTPANWCAAGSGHWRLVGSSKATGAWSSNQCSVATGVFYAPPANTVAVSFNAVVKAGLGHAVAPADIWIIRYN